MRNQTHLSELFNRYVNNECSAEETELLLGYFDNRQDESLLKDLIRVNLENERDRLDEFNPLLQHTFISIKEQIRLNAEHSRVVNMKGTPWKRYVAAAAIFIAAGCSVWFLLQERGNKQAIAVANQPAEILPGGNRAVLTLADGSRIILDSVIQGSLASQGGTRIIKLADGQLAYHNSPGNDSSAAGTTGLYNTISTPKGGQYQIILPDGSSVWLNAASSLRFPVRFVKSDRRVELTGEAYFEITQKAGSPFIVKHDNTEVQVLGTSFNMNAYPDEDAIRTTLLEGSVKVVQDEASVVLKPGQQAAVGRNADNTPDKTIHVQTTDTEDAIAWKNGLFVFNNVDIRSIMRQIARWYDVDIRIEGKLPADKFIGEVPRSSKVSEVLKIMELNNVHFKIEGKIITLTP